MRLRRQFTVGYVLAEIALIALALAAWRVMLAPSAIAMEIRAVSFCLVLTAGAGALGGAALRMAVGLVAGGIFSVASLPLLWTANSWW